MLACLQTYAVMVCNFELVALIKEGKQVKSK